MTAEQIYERIKEILVDRLGVDEDRITMETSFVDDLGADSLDLVELIMELEDEFGKEISDDEAESMTTVNAAVSFIEKNLQ